MTQVFLSLLVAFCGSSSLTYQNALPESQIPINSLPICMWILSRDVKTRDCELWILMGLLITVIIFIFKTCSGGQIGLLSLFSLQRRGLLFSLDILRLCGSSTWPLPGNRRLDIIQSETLFPHLTPRHHCFLRKQPFLPVQMWNEKRWVLGSLFPEQVRCPYSIPVVPVLILIIFV